MPKSVFLLPLLVLLASCGGAPRVDGSSEQAFQASLTEIRESLDEERELEFESALVALSLNQLSADVASAFKGGDTRSEEERGAELRTLLDWLTAEEVVAKAAPARDALLQQRR